MIDFSLLFVNSRLSDWPHSRDGPVPASRAAGHRNLSDSGLTQPIAPVCDASLGFLNRGLLFGLLVFCPLTALGCSEAQLEELCSIVTHIRADGSWFC